MSRVVHFEIPCADVQKVSEFFGAVFDWKFTKWENDFGIDYWNIETGDPSENGINGSLMARQTPEQPIANCIKVADIDATLAAVVAHGGTVALPKMPVPGVGYVAYFMDPEQHIFSLMQSDAA